MARNGLAKYDWIDKSCINCGNLIKNCQRPNQLHHRKYCSNECRSENFRKKNLEEFSNRYKVNKITGCWEWIGVPGNHGYGQISRKLAHRHSYEIHKGEIPNGLFVCHICDNRICVNPDHLFLGSCKDNAQDASQKGRTAHGEKSPFAKLRTVDVISIRESNLSLEELANSYNVSVVTIKRIGIVHFKALLLYLVTVGLGH